MDGSQFALVVRSIQKGVRWLKENTDVLRDPRDIAISIRALIAVEKNPHSHVVQRLISALARQQSGNGSWSDELWDTVWAISALHDVGIGSSNPALDSAIRFITATQDSISGTWYEEPFETILVLELLATVAPTLFMQLGGQPLKWIASLQNNDGCVIGIRYTGMAASLFSSIRNIGIDEYDGALTLCLEYIRRDLANKPIWTSAAWSNYYPLRARRLYKFNLEHDDFVKMAEILGGLKGKFVLSLNDVPEVRAIFKPLKIRSVELHYTAQKQAGKRFKEVLITNF